MEKIRILWNYLKYKNTKKFKTRDSILAFQKAKISKHMQFLNNSSYYYSAFEANINAVPLCDKKLMMTHFNAMNTVSIDRNEALEFAISAEQTRGFSSKLNGITVGLSSGTSNSRGLFLASDEERAIWAGAILARALPGSIFKKHRIAFFLRADSNLYETVSSGTIVFEYFDIYNDFQTNMNKLKAFQPSILVAPPSVLLQIAAEMKTESFITPEKVISVAEVLEESDSAIIKDAFDTQCVHQIYQCTEGFLAYTCDHGTLHINEDLLCIEKEELGDGRFIPIITDFTRKSQPIIRYRLNDILIEKKEPCPCGCPFMAIEKIEGREDDVFIFKAKQMESEVFVFSDFVRRCFLFAGEIENYKAVQIEQNKVVIFLEHIDAKVKVAVVKEFEKLAEDMDFFMPEIEFDDYVHTTDKKMKRVERLLKR